MELSKLDWIEWNWIELSETGFELIKWNVIELSEIGLN